MTKKAFKGKTTTLKYLAAVAEKLLDLTKSLLLLHGILKTLMRIAANLVTHNKSRMPDAHLNRLWGTSAPRPAELRKYLILALAVMHKPVYVVMLVSPQALKLHMHVDASKVDWGASLTHEGTETAFASEWSPKSLS